ncbi:MAG: right-handed parallel beta-helix repeat-containing protein [Sedimentisphaerales bacterium]|nr:right-handed parallel beta-helix repeat-containing protein [Sedimentisphaerales bacterium]
MKIAIIKSILISCLFLTAVSYAKYSGGNGEAKNPYLISTPEDLNSIGDNSSDWSKHFKMTADINMADYSYTTAVIAPDVCESSWFQGTPFTGIFNGNNHTIFSILIDDKGVGNDYLGLFGQLGQGCIVKNLKIADINITGGDNSNYIGGLCGVNTSGPTGYGTISNCNVTGSVSGGDYSQWLGGLCGRNCGIISDCFSTGSVIAGKGSECLGGLCGEGYSYYSTINYCFSTSSTTGGVASHRLGGLCGYNYASTITNCYATGFVTGGDNSSMLGGLCGVNRNSTNRYGIIINCYATGPVTGDESLGGLCGENGGKPVISSYFLNPNDGGGPDNGFGTPLTDEQMKLKSSFVNWDFDTPIWTIKERRDYPHLWWYETVSRTFYVDANGTGDYPTIQAAIDAINDGDEIVLLPGVYTGDGNRDIDFLGKKITVRSTDPNDPNIVASTVIEGKNNRYDPHRGFLFNSDESFTSVLSGITIRNFNYLQNGEGGAILCEGASPWIEKCHIENNAAAYGAIALIDSNAVISKCYVHNNYSAGCGSGAAGIFISGGNVLVENSVITQNKARDRYGGGIGLFGDAPYYHGNIGHLTISNCLIAGNSASCGGGVDCRGYSTIAMQSCTIIENKAHYGGGINLETSELEMSNCILYGNVATSGPQANLYGSHDYTSRLAMRYCDIQHSDKEPGIKVSWNGKYEFEVGNIFTDPCFIDPGHWDPNVHPHPSDDFWLEGDYHLKPESLCINAGDPNYVLEPNCPNDLDGNPRVSEGRIDMGCYEFQAPQCLNARLFMIPKALNPKVRRRMCFAMFILPQGISASDFDRTEKLMFYPCELQSRYQFAFDIKRGHHSITYILGVFDLRQLCGLLGPGRHEVEVVGWLKDDRCFSGSDTIKVVPK